MATPNTLKTRIALRNDTLAAWQSSELKLLAGEVALAKLSDGSFEMRVGTGDKTWSELDVAGQVKLSSQNIINLDYDSYRLSSTVENSTTKFVLQGRVPGTAGAEEETWQDVGNAIGVTVDFTEINNKIAFLSGTIDDVLSAKLPQLSNDLTGVISAVSSELETTIETVSADLYSDLTAVSSDMLSTVQTVSAELYNDLTAVSSDINLSVQGLIAVSAVHETRLTAIEEELSAVTAENPVVTKQDIADLAGAMHFKGVATEELSTGSTVKPAIYGENELSAGDIVIVGTKEFVYDGAKWVELGDEGIYLTQADFETWKTEKYEPETTELSNHIKGLEAISAQISAEVAGLEAISAVLSDAIDTEISTRTDEVEFLSGKIDNKIYAGDYGQTLEKIDSLSVVRIAADNYHDMVKAGTIDDNTVYIVSSDYINAYGANVKNVADAVDPTDAVNLSSMQAAIAAESNVLSTDYNKKFEDLQADSLSGVTINGKDVTIEDNVAKIQIDLIDCGGATAVTPDYV